MKPVLYKHMEFAESSFEDEQGTWTAPYLYEKVAELGLRPEVVRLRHLDLSAMPWTGVNSIDSIAYHAQRAMSVDLGIPIILRLDGYIMDGWHRVLRALKEGVPTIKAYRLDDYIAPDKPREAK